MAIKGTIFEETLEIFLMPPITISPTRAATMIEIILGERPVRLLMLLVIEFTCEKVPIPRSATRTPLKAKNTASGLNFCPYHLRYST